MKSLDQVNIEDIASDKKYLLVVSMYERYCDGGTESYIGTGDEVFEEIKQIFGWEEGGEDGDGVEEDCGNLVEP
jgi:hypothetical protein